jgi:two-component system response regulator PrrA
MSEPKTVLLVDDEADLLSILVFALAMDGYRLLTATCGRQALALLERERVDLLVSDYRMPGLDGLELARAMRALLTKPPRIVFMTGMLEVDGREAEWEALGIDRIVTKPFLADELRSAVRASLYR